MLKDNYRHNIQPKQPKIPLLKRNNKKDNEKYKEIFISQNKFEVLADINYVDNDEIDDINENPKVVYKNQIKRVSLEEPSRQDVLSTKIAKKL